MEIPFYGHKQIVPSTVYQTRHGEYEIVGLENTEYFSLRSVSDKDNFIVLCKDNMQGEIGSCVIVNIDVECFEEDQIEVLQDFLPQVGVFTILSTAKYGYNVEILENCGFKEILAYPTMRSKELEHGSLYAWVCPTPEDGFAGYLPWRS